MTTVQAAVYPCGDTVDNGTTGRLTFRNCAVDVMPGYLMGLRHNAYFGAGVVTVPAYSAVQWRFYFTTTGAKFETLSVNWYDCGFGDLRFLTEQEARLLQCGTTNRPSWLATGPTDLVFKNCSHTTQDVVPGYQLGDRHFVYVNGGVVDVFTG